MSAFTEFFPTPASLVSKLLEGVELSEVRTVLEPSAGKGDIAKVIASHLSRILDRYGDENDTRGKSMIDCIELEPDLRATLKGKGFRVVHDDFLTYATSKQYDLIIANPPFSDGDRHLTKMLDLARYGGIVRCLLNAETLRNPYTFERKTLCKRLAELGAEVTYLPGEFESAERKTSVEVALVKVTIPDSLPDSFIVEELEVAKREERLRMAEPTELAHGDFVKAIVDRYRFEVDVGVRLIREYEAVRPHLLDALHHGKDGDYRKPILSLTINDSDGGSPRGGWSNANVLNDYVRCTRLKYWEALFQAPEFTARLTSGLQKALHEKVAELGDYEFSVINIRSIQADMAGQMTSSIEDTIVKLFDELSCRHAWSKEDDEFARNIHYYNGWATNKAWKINEKVILPFYGKDWDGKIDRFRAQELLGDIERCLGFLAGGKPPTISLGHAIDVARLAGWGKEVEAEHFSFKIFKKGTVHLRFRDERLLARLNIFGSQRKKWLPPSYGRAKYSDMTAADRAVIDSFEGAESYAKVVAEPQAFIIDTGALLALPAPQST